MWIVNYCDKRLTECLRMSETFADTDKERQRAWLELAKQWGRLPEEIVLNQTKHQTSAAQPGQIKSDPNEPPSM